MELDAELVGAIGVDLLEGEKKHVGNVGCWIAADFWNRGIATNALKALTRHGFYAFPIRRLQATVFGWNPASCRVLEKCGYRLEGRLPGAIIKADEITDELWYGLIKPGHPTDIPES